MQEAFLMVSALPFNESPDLDHLSFILKFTCLVVDKIYSYCYKKMKLNLLINPVTFNFLALKSSQILKIDKNIHFLLCTRNQQVL